MTQMKLNHKSRYITFRLADNLIGIDILDIREIVPCIKVTKVQQAPEFVLGLINLRGQILTILDIGVLVGLPKRSINPQSHFIIFKNKDAGFIVDRIGDVLEADQTHVESIPANIDTKIRLYLDNIINLPEEILMILNGKKILSSIQTHYEKPKESQ